MLPNFHNMACTPEIAQASCSTYSNIIDTGCAIHLGAIEEKVVLLGLARVGQKNINNKELLFLKENSPDF
jgi:hypothetical protein